MQLYDELLAGKHSGYVLLAKEDSKTIFFGWGLNYGSNIEPWRLVPGTFNSVVGEQPNDWKKTSGYYVCTPRQPECWTILGTGPYRLNLRALLTEGIPEDIEIFGFEAADRKAGTVKVKWIVRGTYLADAPDGWVFGEGSPAVFRVGFPGYIQGITAFPSTIMWAGE
jgi:hypothetical protein